MDSSAISTRWVFVHGIIGSYQTTWGQFPELLASDEDLPHLDILKLGLPQRFSFRVPTRGRGDGR